MCEGGEGGLESGNAAGACLCMFSCISLHNLRASISHGHLLDQFIPLKVTVRVHIRAKAGYT